MIRQKLASGNVIAQLFALPARQPFGSGYTRLCENGLRASDR